MQYMQDEDVSGQITMPTRTPIIPTTLGNRILLRALHDEMIEKDIIKANTLKHHTESTASSGIHSNSISEESEDHRGYVSIKKKPKHRRKTTGRAGPESTMNRKLGVQKHDSSSERGDSNDTERSSDSERSDKSYSSSEESHSTAKASGTVGTSWTKGHKDSYATLSRSQATNRGSFEVTSKTNNRVELTERDKQEIREGYERYVINGEHHSAGSAFGARKSAFNKVTRGQGKSGNEGFSDNHVTFPLEEAAAGESNDIGLQEAKAFEKNAKQKTKSEKRAIAEAKLTVSEAKLTEFEAKLRARQARIDERHAKLCHRRALIKQAEERLQMLESRLDDEEEDQRERERRVKNRERRVKQEEAGIQIKEISLKKRETKVTDDLMEIERRRKMVEEKEDMSSTMNDIMTKRESLHHGEKRDKSQIRSHTLGRLLRKPASKDATFTYGTLDRKRNARSETSKRREEKMSNSLNPTSPPIPIPRKSLENREFCKTERRARSNSLDSESVLTSEELSKSTKPEDESRTQKYSVGSLPRMKNKNAIMGLWL